MAGKKPIPGHDVEMGGAAGGGVRGSTVRPLPSGSGRGRIAKNQGVPQSHVGSVELFKGGKSPVKLKQSGTSGSVRSSAAKASLMDRVKAKAKKFADSRPQRSDSDKGSPKIWKNVASERRAHNSKDRNASDIKIDFIHADGPAVPKMVKGMSQAVRRQVWSRIPKAQRMKAMAGFSATKSQVGAKAHAEGRQIIQKAIAELKSGKPGNRLDAAPEGVFARAPGQRRGGVATDKAMKSARKRGKANKAAQASRQRGRMVDPDSVPF